MFVCVMIGMVGWLVGGSSGEAIDTETKE